VSVVAIVDAHDPFTQRRAAPVLGTKVPKRP
jgi:hypothetical protein